MPTENRPAGERNESILVKSAVLCACAVVAMAQPGNARRNDLVVSKQHVNFDGFWLLNRAPDNQKRASPPDLPEGWRTFGTPDLPAPKLQPGAFDILKTQRAKEAKAVKITDGVDDQTARCEAGGFPDFLTFDNPMDIIQRTDEVVMVTERERQLPRHIYISPPHQSSDIYTPAKNGILTHNGHSVGHWEGSTLVIESDGFASGPWMFSIERIPHSDAMTTTERLSLSDGGTLLSDQVVITDPKTLKEPWSLKFTWHRAPPDTEAIESSCTIDTDYLGIKPQQP